jgi:hypothetical protein
MNKNENGVKRPVGRPKGGKPCKRINFHMDEDLYTIARMRCELPSMNRYLNNLIRRALMTE